MRSFRRVVYETWAKVTRAVKGFKAIFVVFRAKVGLIWKEGNRCARCAGSTKQPPFLLFSRSFESKRLKLDLCPYRPRSYPATAQWSVMKSSTFFVSQGAIPACVSATSPRCAIERPAFGLTRSFGWGCVPRDLLSTCKCNTASNMNDPIDRYLATCSLT